MAKNNNPVIPTLPNIINIVVKKPIMVDNNQINPPKNKTSIKSNTLKPFSS